MAETPERAGGALRPTAGAALLVIAGLLVSGCTSGGDAEAFAPRWETTFDVATHVVASEDGVILVASDEGQTLAALNTRNGGTRWSLPFTPAPSAVTIRGDVVAVQQQLDGGVRVSAVSASTGNPMWTRTANGGSVIGVFSDGRVAAVKDDTISISDVANARTADPWMPRESCSVGAAQLSPPQGSVAGRSRGLRRGAVTPDPVGRFAPRGVAHAHGDRCSVRLRRRARRRER
ncbi:PQQ-binding-like beta-propeller repeat protein [Microbacterium sp. SMR1]|uniref:outer membrane protein assembly factor BamB family protein n=1 Tax=Microbacterium sp. SMR1 TaxID=1497340 RepID=UPI0015EB7A70|nr:PQQ-binding-like beta-propeller repeat protein [Microbacterium sp. SMR1]